jgi:predicted regulator of Ras-like GTPase activity (Roadblock/LC7/MglB family)
MDRRPPEAKRDQMESAFTPILRKAWSTAPSVLAVAFVDPEGECIDYVSSLDPFEAKVCAAHALVLVDGLRTVRQKLGLEDPALLSIAGSRRELWAWRVSADYLLVAVLVPGADPVQIRAVLASAGREFREEVGVRAPGWEPAGGPLEVIVRPAVGWPYAPHSFRQDGVRVAIADVLGRWIEGEAGEGEGQLVCFRVRTEGAQELTLVHDPGADSWRVRA